MSNSPDEHNQGGLIAFLASMAFCLAFFFYIAVLHPGINLNEVEESTSGDVEMQLADGSAPAAQVDVSQIEKPWLDNEAMLAHGSKVYATNCAVCHGAGGKGDGPAGNGLVPPPRNLVEGNWQKGGTSVALFTTLQKGIEGGSMASFAHLPKVDRWAMVQYIRSITENKVEDNDAELEKFAATAE